jgi:hypothetical protein
LAILVEPITNWALLDDERLINRAVNQHYFAQSADPECPELKPTAFTQHHIMLEIAHNIARTLHRSIRHKTSAMQHQPCNISHAISAITRSETPKPSQSQGKPKWAVYS